MPISDIWGGNAPRGQDLFSEAMGGMERANFGQVGFNRTDVPGAQQYGRFGGAEMDLATQLLDPQRQLAMANLQRQQVGSRAAMGATAAAGGGLSPAAMAAQGADIGFQTQQAMGQTGAQFAGQAGGLAQNIFGMNMASQQAQQQANMEMFGALFGQEQFASQFGLESEQAQFDADMMRREMGLRQAGFSAENQPGTFGGFLGGLATGGVSGFAQGLGMAVGGSDERLKRDITNVGVSPSGIPVYEFRYTPESGLDSESVFTGAIAQEVLEVTPEAVSIGANGFYQVDYGLIDVDFTKASAVL